MSEPERQPPSPLDMLRDPRAIVDTGLGPVAFVAVNALTDLDTAAIVALAISGVVALYRAIRRHPLTNAIGGVLGTGLCVFIAAAHRQRVRLLRAAGDPERRARGRVPHLDPRPSARSSA